MVHFSSQNSPSSGAGSDYSASGASSDRGLTGFRAPNAQEQLVRIQRTSLWNQTLAPFFVSQALHLSLSPRVLSSAPQTALEIGMIFGQAGMVLGSGSQPGREKDGVVTGAVAVKIADVLRRGTLASRPIDEIAPLEAQIEAAALHASLGAYFTRSGLFRGAEEVLKQVRKQLAELPDAAQPAARLGVLRAFTEQSHLKLEAVPSMAAFVRESVELLSPSTSVSGAAHGLPSVVAALCRVGAPVEAWEILRGKELSEGAVSEAVPSALILPILCEIRNGFARCDPDNLILAEVDSRISRMLSRATSFANSSARCDLAEGSLRAGRFSEAITFVKRAIEISPCPAEGGESQPVANLAHGIKQAAMILSGKEVPTRDLFLETGRELFVEASQAFQIVHAFGSGEQQAVAWSAVESSAAKAGTLGIDADMTLCRLASWCVLTKQSERAAKLLEIRAASGVQWEDAPVPRDSAETFVAASWYRTLAQVLTNPGGEGASGFYRGTQCLSDAVNAQLTSTGRAMRLARMGALLAAACGSIEVVTSMRALPHLVAMQPFGTPALENGTLASAEVRCLVRDIRSDARIAAVGYHHARFLSGVKVEVLPRALFLRHSPYSADISFV